MDFFDLIKTRCSMRVFTPEPLEEEKLEHILESIIDLKFCDLWGRWHHLTVPSSQFTSDLMAKGIGFDGSAVRVKSVKIRQHQF